MIARSETILGNNLPEGEAGLNLIAKRIEVLVQDGRLLAQGDIKKGSPRESDERRILGGFPENDEFGLGDRHPLYFQQEIAEVAIAPPGAQ